MQILAIVVSLAITAVGIALFAKAIASMVATIRIGQSAVGRTDAPARRWATMFKETLAHTRMLQWTAVGIGHWVIFVGFGLLFFTLLTAFGQLFDAEFALPLIGHFFLYEWATEFFAITMIAAIVAFIAYRSTRPRERVRGVKGRLYGSTMWQGYFVEAVILGVGLCIVYLRGAEYALMGEEASAFHFPLTFWIGEALSGVSRAGLETSIYLVAMLKIVISFTWMIVLSLNTTMGVAWHRFTAWFNIWFKRESDGGTALGALQPMMAGGRPIDFEEIDDLDEDTPLGVGKVEDFSWKGILDFTSCTECGRCQSQCPAWNTEKPLSPKMLITQLRDHAYKKAPYLLAESEEARTDLPSDVLTEAERPLVGATEGDWAWMPDGGAVIDDDVLWSCTNCGACVQQCPVDIEHIDHIADMRRYQVLVESNFPAELNQLFKGLENKGNPWNMSAGARLEWAKDLPFDVKVVGEDIEDLNEVEWLFWVGCAGAYEDRAKKTTRAVAELLDMAGVTFGVLGKGETCTGDPARRAGNEFVFQGLAAQNAEVLTEAKAKKVVSTCAHCFNTLKNEYAQFGVELEVVHHTQLLNRLVREGKLTPVPTNGSSPKRSITYHDPCFLGRHNQVYSPPRELLDIIPGAEMKEMPRNSERSFCCGAGGARMWMEEKLGERINVDRTKEAVETGADQIAVGCPFCRVMLSDGLTMQQSKGEAREEVEVLDVAQMLLASVKGETRAPAPADPSLVPAGAGAAASAGVETAGAGTADPSPVRDPEALKAEPEAGDVTQTEETVSEPDEVGANAKARESADPQQTSGGTAGLAGGSLFDTPADSTPEPATPAPSGGIGGGSLFDTPADSAPAASATTDSATSEPDSDDTPSVPEPATPAPSGGIGSGSLFDTPADQGSATADKDAAPPAAEVGEAAEAAVDTEHATGEQEAEQPAQPEPSSGGIGGGSLFDIGTEEAPSEPPESSSPAGPSAETDATEASASETASTTPPEPSSGTSISAAGSLFDVGGSAEPTSSGSDATAESESAPAPEPAPEPSDEAPVTAESAAAEDSDAPAGDAPASDASTASAPAASISGASSLFDLGSDPVAETPGRAATDGPDDGETVATAATDDDAGQAGSAGGEGASPAAESASASAEAKSEAEAEAEAEAGQEPDTEVEAASTEESSTPKRPERPIDEQSSLFDL